MNTGRIKEKPHGPLLGLRASRSILPREDRKSSGPKRVRIIPAHPYTTILALFGFQTCSTTINENGRFLQRAEGDNRPCRRIDTKRSLSPISDASVRQQTAREFFLLDPPERRGQHGS